MHELLSSVEGCRTATVDFEQTRGEEFSTGSKCSCRMYLHECSAVWGVEGDKRVDAPRGYVQDNSEIKSKRFQSTGTGLHHLTILQGHTQLTRTTFKQRRKARSEGVLGRQDYY